MKGQSDPPRERDRSIGSGRFGRAGGGWLYGWPFLLPLLYYLSGILRFPYASESASFSDVVISHLPNLIFLKKSLAVWGSVPFWSPLILSGAPFAANPLSGLWYPPGWLAVLLPVPLGFNLLVMAHLVWGAYGMYRLMQLEGVGSRAAILAGVGFAALPKLAAHYGAGHLTLLYAVPWTPWLLWAWQSGKTGGRYRRAGGILAMIFLADVRWAAYAGLLGVFWLFAHSRLPAWGITHENGIRRAARRVWVNFWEVVAHALIAALLAAPLALPLWEFTRLTTRARLAASDVLAFSLPPSRLLGFIFPDFGGNPEWMAYPGGFILALGLLAYTWPVVRREARFWIWALPVSVLFGLGEYLPGMSSLASLPGLNLLRVPPRALFISGISLIILAVYAVDHLLAGPDPHERRRAGLLLAGLAGFGLVTAVGVRAITGVWVQNFLWGGIAVLAGCLWLLAGLHSKVPPRVWFAGLVGLSLLDWGAVNQTLLAPRLPEQVYAAGADAAEILAGDDEFFRTYSPSYSLPQQTSAQVGIEMADGVDPLQLQAYAGFMAAASGIPTARYSVTLPPFASGDPSLDNAAYTPDLEQLGWLNVRYVLSEFDLAAEGLIFLRRYGPTRIYANSDYRPRAWVQAGPGEVGPIIGGAEITRWRPNQIRIKATGPGILVLSEIDYPGWQVQLDGKPTDMVVISGLLRGAALPAGAHEVLFQFRPITVYLGLAGSLAGLLILIGRPIRRRRA